MTFYISILFACMHMYVPVPVCMCICMYMCEFMFVYVCHVCADAQRGKTKQSVLYPVQNILQVVASRLK